MDRMQYSTYCMGLWVGFTIPCHLVLLAFPCVLEGDSEACGFLCCLLCPISSLGRLPVGLGSLNEIPVPQDLMMMMFMTIFAGV